MPGVTIRRSPNYEVARRGQAVKAVVLHIAAGGYDSSISWLCRPNGRSSAHFMIAKDGRICQMVDIADTAWANGLSYVHGRWIDPENNVVSPSWPGLTPFINPNYQTISIEHEGQPLEPWTAAMFDANARVLRWLAQETGLVYQPAISLIGHNVLSPTSRPNCPGPHVDFAAVAASAGRAPLAGATIASYRVRNALANGGAIDNAAVRTGRGTQYPKALGDTLTLPVGYGVEVDDVQDGWAHLTTNEGFVSRVLLAPVEPGDLTWLHAPRISQTTFRSVLQAANSPAWPVADALYQICARLAIDPGVALALFGHESSYGTRGICKDYDTRNWGNVRVAFNATRGEQLDITGRGQFFRFATWEAGLTDWCERIVTRYVRERGLATVRAALPIYAPSEDGNAPDRYADSVVADVRRWQGV